MPPLSEQGSGEKLSVTAAAVPTATIQFPRVGALRKSSQAVNAGKELWQASKSLPDGLESMVGSLEAVGQHSKCTNQHSISKVILQVLTERQAGKHMQSQMPIQKYSYELHWFTGPIRLIESSIPMEML